jgi:WD40 repeat protein
MNGIIKEIRLHEKKIGCISVCKDGKYLATASNDSTVGLWDLRKLPTETSEQSDALHTLTFRRSVTSVYFNPINSAKILSTCYDDHVRVHYNLTVGNNISHSEISHNNQTGRWITNFKAVWDPKSPDYAVVGNMNRGIDIINAGIGGIDSAEIVRNITSDYLTAQPAVNAFHPNLDVIASGNASGKIAIWSRCI